MTGLFCFGLRNLLYRFLGFEILGISFYLGKRKVFSDEDPYPRFTRVSPLPALCDRLTVLKPSLETDAACSCDC